MMDGKHHTELVRDIQSVRLRPGGARRARHRPGARQRDRLGLRARGARPRTATSGWSSTCPRRTSPSATPSWSASTAARSRSARCRPRSSSPSASTRRSRSIGVYDPYLHYSVFHGIVGVLSEKASKVFRFEEQNQLHEEIIDTGLAQIYQSHLDVAERMALDAGVEVEQDAARRQGVPEGPRPRAQDEPVAAGRRPDRRPQPGGRDRPRAATPRTCCAAARATSCSRRASPIPSIDVRAEESIKWTPEAEERMTARAAAGQGHRPHRHPAPGAREGPQRGHQLGDRRGDGALHAEAGARRDRSQLAERMALELAEPPAGRDLQELRRRRERARRGALRRLRRRRARARSTARCSSGSPAPKAALTEEVTYDGRKLRWSEERQARPVDDEGRLQAPPGQGAHREDARACASSRRSPSSSRSRWSRRRPGAPLRAPGRRRPARRSGRSRPMSRRRSAGAAAETQLVARDAKNVPLLSAFAWNGEAASASSACRRASCATAPRTASRSSPRRGPRGHRPRPGRGRHRDRPQLMEEMIRHPAAVSGPRRVTEARPRRQPRGRPRRRPPGTHRRAPAPATAGEEGTRHLNEVGSPSALGAPGGGSATLRHGARPMHRRRVRLIQLWTGRV